MSKSHLKLKVARAELKAVKQSLGGMCYSPFLSTSCTCCPMANLWAIPDDCLPTYSGHTSLHLYNTILLSDLSPDECKSPLAGLFLPSPPTHWSPHSTWGNLDINEIMSLTVWNPSMASNCTSSTIHTPSPSLQNYIQPDPSPSPQSHPPGHADPNITLSKTQKGCAWPPI